jgi:hypothetical protein
MNLRWNPTFHRFEAEFSTDFQGDLTAVKTAGFRTDGPPGWVWYSLRAAPLNKLRENRPASGLTINADAKEQYVALWKVEEANAKIKAELATHQKTLKKKLKEDKQDEAVASGPQMKMCELGFMCISREDLPPMLPYEKEYKAPPPPDLKCFICQAPIYFYETQNPPTCLWCEKTVLDNVKDVC